MRSIWSGTIGFGTIQIPVRMYSASEDLKVSMNQVHAEDKGRVRYKKVCEVCQKELVPDDIIKAYPVGEALITFTDEELEALRPAKNKAMRIVGFCAPGEIPLVALEKPFYIGTESKKNGGVGQPFALLREVMLRTGKVAVVAWVARSSEQIGMLQPHGQGFLLKTILYSQQIRSIEEVEVLDGAVSDGLVKKGVELSERLAIAFDWTAYRETYTEELREIIEKRAMGEEVKVESPVVKSVSKDLEAELEKSLGLA